MIIIFNFSQLFELKCFFLLLFLPNFELRIREWSFSAAKKNSVGSTNTLYYYFIIYLWFTTEAIESHRKTFYKRMCFIYIEFGSRMDAVGSAQKASTSMFPYAKNQPQPF